MKIEIFSDIACPWCFIGKRRFEKALDSFQHKDQVEVIWRSYQLDPTLPEHYDGTELDYLAAQKGLPRDQVRAMFAQVSAQAAAEGLNYDFDSLVVANSFHAHQLIHLAATYGKAGEAKELLLHGHFEQGKDIGSREYLTTIGTDLGLPESEIAAIFDAGAQAEAVRADFAAAREMGVTGVPFYVFDRKYGVSGAQPSATFASVLD